MRQRHKRLLWTGTYLIVLTVIGMVGGVLYPYTELLFDQDLSQRQRDRHLDTVMIDDADMAWERAAWGAVWMLGMGALVFGVRAFRRSSDAEDE